MVVERAIGVTAAVTGERLENSRLTMTSKENRIMVFDNWKEGTNSVGNVINFLLVAFFS